MYNRAEAVDLNFQKFVREGRFPKAKSQTSLGDADLSKNDFLELFYSQILSRQLDLRARILKAQNECYYTIGSSGHEGNAAIGKVFRLGDMGFLHYRSGALMIQRGRKIQDSDPVYDTMLSFVASSEDPIAGGRHKVWGSHPLLIPPQTSTIASHLPKALGTALSIGRAKDLKLETAVMPHDAVVFCNFGDASINHSTAVGAVNSTLWISHQNIPVPLVYICEDNGIGVSVPTPDDWLESQYGHRAGLKYIPCDGLNLCDTYLKTRMAETFTRTTRKPVFLHFHCVRMLGHAGSDVENVYRSLSTIEADEFEDPLLHSARIALDHDLMSAADIIDMYKKAEAEVAEAGERAKTRPKFLKREEIRESLLACAFPKKAMPSVSEAELRKLLGPDIEKPSHLAKLINWGLVEILQQYPGALVFGEDVAKKGGVYNVTEGLFKRFGPRRVFNSLLDEQTILGNAIGFAHNGFLPIPEIQFLAYVHNAEDQIRGEAATLAFFSQGKFTNGMLIRVAGLPYQKGFGGHFHNDNSLAVFRDIPGVIIAVPSNGEDAVRMLRTCAYEAWVNGRVVVFVEPIALYMTRDLHELNDKKWAFNFPLTGSHKLGEFGVSGDSSELCILTYGNGYYYSKQAAKILEEKHVIKSKIVDLRWMAPIDKDALVKEAATCSHVLIVDECRKTGSWSEWMCGALLESLARPPRVKVVAADDCFIPLGKAAAAGLPSVDEIVAAALTLTGKSKPSPQPTI